MKGYNLIIAFIVTQNVVPMVQSFTATTMIEKQQTRYIKNQSHHHQQRRTAIGSMISMNSKWTMMPDEPAPEVRMYNKK
jgi:hypothetical protein